MSAGLYSVIIEGITDLVQFCMDGLRPTVLIHVIAQILVFGIKLVLQPDIEVALNSVLRDREAAALFQDNPVQFEFRKGILKILAQVGEIGGLLFRVSVILPERGDDLAVGCLSPTVVDQQRDNFLRFGILEGDGLTVRKQFKVPEGLCEQTLLVLLDRGMAQVIEFSLKVIPGGRFQQVSAGVLVQGCISRSQPS